MRSRAYASVAVNRVDVAEFVRGRDGQEVVVGMDVGKHVIMAVVRWPDGRFERPALARDGGDSAPGGMPSPPPFAATAGSLASAATSLPPPGILPRNTVSAATLAGTTARTPSADSDARADLARCPLEHDPIVADTAPGPRELSLPSGKSRGGSLYSSREALCSSTP